LRYATALANQLGAAVELLHVVEDPYVTGAWSSEIYVPNIPELLHNLITDARRCLAEMQTVASNAGVLHEATPRRRPAPSANGLRVDELFVVRPAELRKDGEGFDVRALGRLANALHA
jgi:hypothetical protein